MVFLFRKPEIWHADKNNLFLKLSGSAFAAHPLISDDPGVQAKGRFQLECNSEYGIDIDAGYKHGLTNPEVDKWLLAGVTDRFLVGG